MKSKLYKEYYPILTEEDKEKFIHSTQSKIEKILKIEELEKKIIVSEIFKEYDSKKKVVFSTFGNIRVENIIRNECLEKQKNNDYRLKSLWHDIESISQFKHKMKSGLLSIDDVNIILCLENNIFRRNVFKILLSIIIIIFLAILFLM